MNVLSYIIIFTLIGSIVSLIGGVILLSKEKFAYKISHFLSAYAVGALLGASFLDLLPEAAREAGAGFNIFLWVLVGIVLFFLLERFIHWFHHHHEHPTKEKQSIIPLVVIGDTIHNFIDGVVIAGTFLVSIPLGIVTTLAVAAHEIPQEIGDFGILLNRGVKKAKVLWVNTLSSLSALFGALITYILGESIEAVLPIFISLTAGFFIYIALSDLIPEIHNEDNKTIALAETFLMLLGILTIYLFVRLFEGR